MAFKNLKQDQFLQSNFPFFNYTLDYALDALERMGAGKLEFYGNHPQFCMDDVTYTDMKVLKHKLDAHGLAMHELNPENCAYPTNLASLDPTVRKRTFKYYENAVHTASTCGAPYVLIFPGFAPMDGSQEEAWKLAVDSMKRLSDIAKMEGVTITFEATTRNLTVITDHKKIMELIRETGNDNFAVTIDLMCLSQTKESVLDVYDICGVDKVAMCHFTDGELMPGNSWEHRVPGEGTLDMDDLLMQFDQMNYKGYFGNEIKGSVDPAVTTPQAVCAKIQKWWDDRF